MKDISVRTISLIFFLFTLQLADGQTLKFGHINTDELIKAMPEYDSAMAKLEKLQKELINYLEVMQVELNNKYEQYNKEAKNLSDLVRQAKEREISEMSRKIQDFQLQAQNQLQEEQTNLTKPILDKVDKAIKDVGKEGGFIYIFDVANRQLLYFDEARSVNIMPQVKTKLGLK
ncbi:MAG: OmpH family outer membrane protein [Bacteroidales bacterium]